MAKRKIENGSGHFVTEMQMLHDIKNTKPGEVVRVSAEVAEKYNKSLRKKKKKKGSNN